MAVDQAWQDEFVAQVDHAGAWVGLGADMAVAHRNDLASFDHHGRCTAWLLSRMVEQLAGLHQHGVGRGEGDGGNRQQGGN